VKRNEELRVKPETVEVLLPGSRSKTKWYYLFDTSVSFSSLRPRTQKNDIEFENGIHENQSCCSSSRVGVGNID
jgi:hypothetical protein